MSAQEKHQSPPTIGQRATDRRTILAYVSPENEREGLAG
jgi:hypothetical protein